METSEILVNVKYEASCQTNMSSKHYYKTLQTTKMNF